MKFNFRPYVLTLLAAILSSQLYSQAHAEQAEPVLHFTFGKTGQQFTSTQLLSRPDVIALEIPQDVAYGKAMTFKAVPLLALIGNKADEFDVLEASATDGYVSQLPMALIRGGAQGGSIAWIAIEEASNPWPSLPKKDYSAGPFYLVWQHPATSKIQNSHWPYALATLEGVRSPAMRWPQMAVAHDASHDAARRGLQVFVTHCFTCHQMKGAGSATMGPDLGKPMHVTDYFTEKGLRALIRNPMAVRSWPDQQMAGIDEETLPDAQLDDLIAYFKYMGRR